MKEAVYAALSPVKSRQQREFILRTTAYGFVAGSLACYALGAGRVFLGWAVTWETAALALAAGPVVGLLAGLILRRSWKSAAKLVDTHYLLKDRTVSALEFINKAETTELHALQIADALDHLRRVEPKKVVPFQAPRALPVGVAACALAAVGLFWPVEVAQIAARTQPAPDEIVAAADHVLSALTNLEEKAKEEDNQDLAEKVADLKKKAEDMKKDGVDEREALATLSEIQAKVQSEMAQFNEAVMDGQLQSLGAALSAANAFEGAGKALQEAKLEKAVQELEKVEEPKMTSKEQKSLEEKLKQVSKQAGDVGLGALSSAAAELGENVKNGKGGVGKSAKRLGKVVDAVRKRKKVNELLADALENLKEAKCNCNKNGGPRVRQPEKSNSPSGNWGRGISGNGLGARTKLPSTRNQVELTGTPGDTGDSDVETSTSPEAREQASRSYKDRYQKYRKESDAVLEGEAIPLGQRQMIRKYFESIRPQNTDSSEKSDTK